MTSEVEVKRYFNILCNNNYPEFINKYLELDILKRIDYIGIFCGADYTKIHNIKYWYSRLDHSIAVALIVWNFTKDKTETLAALFHDIGTPCFSHCVDYLLGDSVHQESSEKNVFDILSASKEVQDYLISDGVSLNSFSNFDNFPILENEKPRICADRLDGILSTSLMWTRCTNLDEIAEIYKNMIVLENESGKPELGFKSMEVANDFFLIAMKYSMALQSNTDKFGMQYIADALKKLIDTSKLTLGDLYSLKEMAIVDILQKEVDSWNEFAISSEVIGSDEKPNQYAVSIESKKRYVVPLTIYNGKSYRLDKLSLECQSDLEKYFQYKSKKYSYIKGIKNI